jgi:hypothetical protein
MTNEFNPIEYARFSAAAAIENGDGFEDPVGSYRDNLIDTFAEYGVTCPYITREAFAVYDAAIAAAR